MPLESIFFFKNHIKDSNSIQKGGAQVQSEQKYKFFDPPNKKILPVELSGTENLSKEIIDESPSGAVVIPTLNLLKPTIQQSVTNGKGTGLDGSAEIPLNGVTATEKAKTGVTNEEGKEEEKEGAERGTEEGAVSTAPNISKALTIQGNEAVGAKEGEEERAVGAEGEEEEAKEGEEEVEGAKEGETAGAEGEEAKEKEGDEGDEEGEGAIEGETAGA